MEYCDWRKGRKDKEGHQEYHGASIIRAEHNNGPSDNLREWNRGTVIALIAQDVYSMMTKGRGKRKEGRALRPSLGTVCPEQKTYFPFIAKIALKLCVQKEDMYIRLLGSQQELDCLYRKT